MREIKFRAWDNINKCFHYATMDDLLDGTRPLDIRVEAQEGRLGEMEQFTGLRDKNGKEIYEGDILERYSAMVPKGSNPIIRQAAVWSEYKWAGINAWGDCKVIGNIHENPELLA